MSSTRRDGLFTFDCDGAGCHANFQADEPSDTFKETWSIAKARGWVIACTYVKGISTWQHFCPRCKTELGD